MSNLTSRTTGVQPSISQNTTTHINPPIIAVAEHLINGANPFTEIQHTEAQIVPLQNIDFSDVLFSGSSFV
ncbi:15261_t:CDS:1, partial [Gigaspora rosea]